MAMENGIMPVMDYGDNNNNWVWMFMLFALFGWGRNGYGEQAVTPTQMQSGFDTAEILGKLDRLDNTVTSGLCDGFYSTNMGMANGFAQTKEAIGQVRFDTQVQTGEINRGIDSLKYDNAMQTQQIMKNDCENTQRILDAISKSRIEELQEKVQKLEMSQALGNVVRYPSATTYTAGFSPCFNSQGCGCE